MRRGHMQKKLDFTAVEQEAAERAQRTARGGMESHLLVGCMPGSHAH